MKLLRALFRRLSYFFRRLYRLARRLFTILVVKPMHELGSPLMRAVVYTFQLLFFTVRDMIENRTNVRTGAMAFYTLLSVVPLLAVVFAVAKALGYVDWILESLYGLFPAYPEIVDYCVEFAERTLARTKGGVMAMVGGLITLWSATSLLDQVVQSISDTWKVESERNLFKRYLGYLGILIFFPTVAAGAVLLARYLTDLFGIGHWWLYKVLAEVVALGSELALFALFYKMVPATHVKWRSAIVAGLSAGLVFWIFHHGFALLLTWMTSYSAIYGSFAALPLFLFWLKWSWQILLTGNELAYAHQHLHLLREEHSKEHER